MRKWVRRTAMIATAATVMLALALFVLYRAAQQVPEFYAQALKADPARQAQASDGMVRKTTALVSDVEQKGRWQALFTEEEINAWLAIDLLKNHPGLLPDGVSDPRVVIRPDRMIAACRFDSPRIKTVLSVTLDVYLARPNVVALRIRGIRAGLVPLPMAQVLDEGARAAQRMNLHLQWQQADGDPVALVSIRPPENEKGKQVRIESLKLGAKEVYMAGNTE